LRCRKCDGLTADPVLRRLIATVNEDANSSLDTIDPVARTAPRFDGDFESGQSGIVRPFHAPPRPAWYRRAESAVMPA